MLDNMGVSFDARAYGEEVAAILLLDGAGERLMPLAGGVCSSEEARRRIQAVGARRLFPASRAPQAALSGLYLYFSCLDEAHQTAQNVPGPDGSYWHGIVHRQEPDPQNAAYWFARVGRHPVHPALCEAARGAGMEAGAWDPAAFIEFCERARRQPGSDLEAVALAVQRAEWQLLFDYCARPPE